MNSTQDSAKPRHPIQVVVRRTGLTADLLRAWERRYGAVDPGRTDTGRRLYSDDDVERLVLLRNATSAGRAIRHVADLSTQELRDLIQEDTAASIPTPRADPPAPVPGGREPHVFVERGLAAAEAMDTVRLRSVLDSAALALGRDVFVTEVAAPLAQAIGAKWEEGTFKVSHEHLATAVIQSFLSELMRVGQGDGSGRTIVVATPSGQRHQIGALLAASKAVSLGWSVVYLGADLPAADIAAAVQQSGAVKLALSVVYPNDDGLMTGEMRTLRGLLPDNVAIVVGGRAAESYRELWESIDAEIADLDEFTTMLAG